MSRPQTRAERFNGIPPEIAARSHYIVEPWGKGWALTVRRRGAPIETILVETPGELNRIRQKLTDSGLVGVNPRAK